MLSHVEKSGVIIASKKDESGKTASLTASSSGLTFNHDFMTCDTSQKTKSDMEMFRKSSVSDISKGYEPSFFQ